MHHARVSSILAASMRRWHIAVAIAVAAAACFLPALANGFVDIDDHIYLTANRVVQQGLTWHGVAWAFRDVSGGYWNPLTWLSHMLDWQLFGPRGWGHHLVGILLHAATAA